ncbi:hypothetical protein ACP4OV_014830 [Aristida adscensionis]
MGTTQAQRLGTGWARTHHGVTQQARHHALRIADSCSCRDAISTIATQLYCIPIDLYFRLPNSDSIFRGRASSSSLALGQRGRRDRSSSSSIKEQGPAS